MADTTLIEVTIADSDTESDVVNITDFYITTIQIPASMTGTALTFEVGDTDTTTVPLKDDDNADISLTIGSSAAAYSIDARHTAATSYMRVVSGSAESGAKTIKLHGYRI